MEPLDIVVGRHFIENPRHGRSSHFVDTGLFKDLTSFNELEMRIADLPEPDRGAAFEVFAEGYFAVYPTENSREVWPWSSAPISILQSLALDTTRDKGVDGIIENQVGQYQAYQVKFRSGRKRLKWSELSNFVGLADSQAIHSRVLFTNCDDLPSDFTSRRDLRCIRGNHLDILGEDDLAAISNWLIGQPKPVPKKNVRPYQAEAIERITSALASSDRTTAIMACGTGKTLVALWVAEQIQPRTVLVLLPSLALLSQTFHEWSKETVWRTRTTLCVCSDDSVSKGDDSILSCPLDADFPVSTNSYDVAQFLRQDGRGVQIVFSTYKSAYVVSEAMRAIGPDYAFDLGIFDEAHRTAGREGRYYSFALEDSNVRIKKRLFLTATPRHYDLRKDALGDPKLVYSMDDPANYGDVSYRLSFADAAERNLICKYKVIISVISSTAVDSEMLKRSSTTVSGEQLSAEHVAFQLALAHAVQLHELKKVFTFHRTVRASAAFVSDGPEGIKNHIQDFASLWVSGEMPTRYRRKIIREFRSAKKAIMSNARCLTEGVDVPEVDLVAFMAPRRNHVDIVQATGRAMRRDRTGEKTMGFVLVPLFVKQHGGESLEDAVAPSDFGEIWDVLNALQDHDGVLADTIRTMREDLGRIGSFSDRAFRDRVEILGPDLPLDLLRRIITTNCVERLGSAWDEKFGRLKAFYEAHGHCRVPQTYHEDPGLGMWVSDGRKDYRAGKLSKDRIARLNEVGFEWEPNDADWEKRLGELRAFKVKHGHCNVPSTWKENPGLAGWVAQRRTFYRQGRMDQNQITFLEQMGFRWSGSASKWDRRVEQLIEYREESGNCDVPLRYQKNPALGRWVQTVRRQFRKGRLAQAQVNQLQDLGFCWDTRDVNWEHAFAELQAYQKQTGHCNVTTGVGSNLGTWVTIQRAAFKVKRLTQDRITRLESIGFQWNRFDALWEEKFVELTDYRNKHGHCDVPQHWPDNPRLGAWVSAQRHKRTMFTLVTSRIERLDAIRFKW